MRRSAAPASKYSWRGSESLQHEGLHMIVGVSLAHLDADGLRWAQDIVWRYHYRHATVPTRACPEAWAVRLGPLGRVGCFIVGRPQSTRCYPWYGSLGDVATGRAALSRWCVLNLARVWFSPAVQPGGEWHSPRYLPGYTDRRGIWRSTLASTAIGLLARRVGAEYLTARPPVFLDEPYAIHHLMSYCDLSQHKGTIYRAAGFDLCRTNRRGIQTWRLPLPPLTADEDAAVRAASATCARARRFRAGRASRQLALPLVA